MKSQALENLTSRLGDYGPSSINATLHEDLTAQDSLL